MRHVRSDCYHSRGLFHYGAVTLRRERCPECGEYAIVIDDKIQCCEAPTPQRRKRLRHYRIVETGRRKRPSSRRAKELLAEQDNRCIFCHRQFGSLVHRKNPPQTTVLTIHWDHLDPYVRSGNSRPENFAAACQICNLIKTDHIFSSIEDASIYIAGVWEDKGIGDVKPEIPQVEDLDAS